MADSPTLTAIGTIAEKDSALRRSGRKNGAKVTFDFGYDQSKQAASIAVFLPLRKLRITVEPMDEPKVEPFAFDAQISPLDTAIRFSGRKTGSSIQFEMPEHEMAAYKRLIDDCCERALRLRFDLAE